MMSVVMISSSQYYKVQCLSTLQVCECLQRFSGLLGSIAYCSPGELGSVMEEKAHALNMASLSNRQSAVRLCAQLAAG